MVKANLERGFPETISMLVKYLIVGIGYFLAITSLGFEMSQLAIIFGALSVGIGFGLQNIFNNLVSGLILIFSRPIRIDDTIEIIISATKGEMKINKTIHTGLTCCFSITKILLNILSIHFLFNKLLHLTTWS